MKNTLLVTAFAFVLALGAASFTSFQTATISGKIIPADGAELVWAIKDADSLSTKPAAGSFKFDLKPGIYMILIDAKEPYKDVQFEKVEVTEGKSLDLGEIKLEK